MEEVSLSRPTTVLGPLSKRAEWWPLTARQSLIWADEQLLTRTRYHHWLLWIRFDGPIDVERFHEAWDDTARSHDALSLIVDMRAPRQRFAVGLPSLRSVDIPDGVPIEQWLGEQATRDFTPARQPWEATLVRGAGDILVFVLHAHYLIGDEQSFHVLVTELDARYRACSIGSAVTFRHALVEFATQKPDHTANDPIAEEHRYWDRLLAEPPPIAIPLEGIRGKASSGTVRMSRWLSGNQSNQLHEQLSSQPWASDSEVESLQILVATMTCAWLYLVTGQSDLVLAFPVDQRAQSDAELVGLCSDMFFLRIHVEDSDTFASLATRVRSAFADAMAHRRVSLGDPGCVSALLGVQEAWPETFCGNPACFQLGNAAIFTQVGLGEGDDRNDLAVRLVRQSPSVGFQFDFNSAYTPAVRDRLAGYFLNLVAAWLADTEQHLRGIDWLSADDVANLSRWGTGREPATALDLLERLRGWGQATPDVVAAEHRSRRMTYRELDAVSMRFAQRLSRLNVRSGCSVAVALPRGLEELTAIIGILKLGATYIPIDPAHPAERVRIVLDDGQPEVVVMRSNCALRAALPPNVHACVLDDIDQVGSSEAPTKALEEVSNASDLLAYVLFTSGSTGRPKGVEISRGAFANFLQSMQAVPGVSSRDRVLAITTMTFDIAGLELFLPLYAGATVVLVDKETAADPLQLKEFLEKNAVTVMQATPATWRLLLDTGWSGHAQLRMLCGGEAMSLPLACRLLACGAELWNLYGPTETTVWSTLERIRSDSAPITIGQPIDHTQVTLRDAHGRLIAPGAVGEICIAGRGLARGYRGRPDLTAERFRFDPDNGQRYYRTGDLGRYLEGGRLECLGRLDNQVKIRGFRIELAEIEAQLRSVQGVAEVVALAQGSGEQDPILVAYWVGSAQRDALLQRARATLPPYMVPSAYVQLDQFPLTTSGKIDRKQLPSPTKPSDSSHVPGVILPRNDRESIVASAFREVLGIGCVSVKEDFFALGGTSVRAIQLRSRIADQLGITLPLRVLFEDPTVEGIVARLDSTPNPDDPVVAWIRPGAERVPWIGVMGIHLFEDIARQLPEDQPLLGMHVPARYIPGVDQFPTIIELARKYVALVLQHQPEGPCYLMGLCHGGVVAFETAVQLEALGRQVGIVALLDAELPSARHISRGHQLKNLLREMVGAPQDTARRALAAIGDAIRGYQTKPWRQEMPSFHGEPVDMPFEGIEIDEELHAYQQLGRRTRAHVMTFRATKNDYPPWVLVDRDLGWGDRAERVTSFDIAASHLGIVRESAAAEVAVRLNSAKSAQGR